MPNDTQSQLNVKQGRRPKANRRYNTRKYKARRSGITYATAHDWSRKVIRRPATPEELDELQRRIERGM